MGERDETCPVSTEGWTRRVHVVREGGGGHSGFRGWRARSGRRRLRPRRARAPRAQSPRTSRGTCAQWSIVCAQWSIVRGWAPAGRAARRGAGGHHRATKSSAWRTVVTNSFVRATAPGEDSSCAPACRVSPAPTPTPRLPRLRRRRSTGGRACVRGCVLGCVRACGAAPEVRRRQRLGGLARARARASGARATSTRPLRASGRRARAPTCERDAACPISTG